MRLDVPFLFLGILFGRQVGLVTAESIVELGRVNDGSGNRQQLCQVRRVMQRQSSSS